MTNPIGAHVSGGLNLMPAIAQAQTLGLEAIQVFLSAPQGWRFPTSDPALDEAFRIKKEELGLRVFDHASYLANFVSGKEGVRAGARALLPKELARAGRLGAEGVILHAGSTTGAPREDGYRLLREELLPILEKIPADGPQLLIEPMAGQGNMLASLVSDIAPYLEALEWHPKVGVCLDTCHLHAAGEELDLPNGTTLTLDSFGREIGFHRLGLIHANDSKFARGAKKDRHENVGQGFLGAYCFPEIFAYSGVVAPLVLETPFTGYASDLAALRAARG